MQRHPTLKHSEKMHKIYICTFIKTSSLLIAAWTRPKVKRKTKFTVVLLDLNVFK